MGWTPPSRLSSGPCASIAARVGPPPCAASPSVAWSMITFRSMTASSEVTSASLFTRHPGNPLLTPERWPYPINAVMNAGATVVDGQTVLMCRVEDRRGFSNPVSYTHLRAHETDSYLVCRLLLE